MRGQAESLLGTIRLICLPTQDFFDKPFQHRADSGRDVVLGSFRSGVLTVVGHLKCFVINPKDTSLSYTWICAVSTPAFTMCLNDSIIIKAELRYRPASELFSGHVHR